MLDRILSTTSEYSVLSEESDQDEQENKGTKSCVLCFNLSCFILVLICIVIFITTFVTERLKESSCPLEDPACLSLICPVGMSWDNTSGQCHPPGGYKCCVDNVNIYSCFRDVIKDNGYDRCRKDILATGVAPSPQAMCYPGFVWVPRKKKCVPVR